MGYQGSGRRWVTRRDWSGNSITEEEEYKPDEPMPPGFWAAVLYIVLLVVQYRGYVFPFGVIGVVVGIAMLKEHTFWGIIMLISGIISLIQTIVFWYTKLM